MYIEEVRISGVRESGKRYAVYAYVVYFDKERGTGIVDDGENTMEILLENYVFADLLKEGRPVRLIGRGEIGEGKRRLRVSIVHELGSTPDLYYLVNEIERRWKNEAGV